MHRKKVAQMNKTRSCHVVNRYTVEKVQNGHQIQLTLILQNKPV